jgi:hypothetical protein
MRRHKSAAQPVEIARQAVEAAREAAQNIDLDTVRDTVATEVTKDVELVLDETRHRPLRALLIALGLGALIGAVVDRMRRKSPPATQRTANPT